jgi:hypothetical protein
MAIPTGAAILLYVLILDRLFRHHLRTYSILFINLLVLLFTVVIDSAYFFGQEAVGYSETARTVYFINDLLRQAMVYILVISLILRAVEGSARFQWVGRWLVLAAFLLAAGSFLVHWDTDRFVAMMTNVIRNVSLVAMLMNLLLWVLLVRKRTSDRTLLLVTTGLGLQMAGEAMGQSLRLINAAAAAWGNVVLILAHLLCLAVWYSAFKRRPAPQA